jgi:hypothetical protein
MAGAGKAFIKHTRGLSPPEQVHDNGFGHPPHPLELRSGMRFFPRKREPRRSVWPLVVRGAVDERGQVRCRREDPAAPADVVVSAGWLLQRRGDGQGRHVQFAGWAPRKYGTFALVVAVEETLATLVLVEWHPARPVPLDARLLPTGARVGSWLAVKADLSAGRPAKLAVSHLRPVDVPAGRLCDVTYRPPARMPARGRPEVGEGCGDIVVTVDPDVLSSAPRSGGLLELFVYRRPEGCRPGDQVFLAPTGQDVVEACLTVEEVRPLPVGALVRCRPAVGHLAEPVTVPAGERHTTRWQWRWFNAPPVQW